MNPDRPFSSPFWVSLAGLTLLALAMASFTTGLSRQLRLPRQDNSAQVVVVQPTDAAPPTALAYAAPALAEPAKHRPAPRPAPQPEAPPLLAPIAPPAPPASAAEVAEDAAATGPSPLEEPAPPPPEEPQAPPY